MHTERFAASENEGTSTPASRGPLLESYRESVGATEDQVNMAFMAPQRLNSHGVSAVDLAGTGEHDARGG